MAVGPAHIIPDTLSSELKEHILNTEKQIKEICDVTGLKVSPSYPLSGMCAGRLGEAIDRRVGKYLFARYCDVTMQTVRNWRDGRHEIRAVYVPTILFVLALPAQALGIEDMPDEDEAARLRRDLIRYLFDVKEPNGQDAVDAEREACHALIDMLDDDNLKAVAVVLRSVALGAGPTDAQLDRVQGVFDAARAYGAKFSRPDSLH